MATQNLWRTAAGRLAARIAPTALGGRLVLTLMLMLLTTASAWAWSGEGNEDSPYQISTVADLIQLANDVNSGTTYEGFFFKLMNNIDFNDNASLKPTKVWDDDTSTEQNFPGIGGRNTANRTFNGTFDGNNKTISGIRIYSGGTDNTDKQRGLFGRIGSGGTVKNLTLSNARITGYTRTGGIAGWNFGKIDSCHVTNTVCIHSFISDGVNDYHGGVAGHNSNSTGIITNCTSSAKLTVKEGVTAGLGYGGIVGYNSTSGKLRNNFVSGATIPTAKGNSHGAIAGRNDDGTMTNNYYTGCTVAGTENASNVGCMGADVTTANGAIGIRVLALGTNVTASGFTVEYNSTTYYYGTVTLGFSGTVPTGGIVKYAVNGDYISGNEFTISCDANVTAVVVYPYADISGLTYHGSTFDILGNTYVTSGSYYEINDEQDLIDLGDFTASNAANNCEGLTFKLTADLDFTNMSTRSVNGNSGNFHPIGLVEDASFDGIFSGHFDGQNHTIKGLRYTNKLRSGSNYNDITGLFKTVAGSSAVVERVALIDPQMSGTDKGCGGIAGVIRNGATIRNCTVLGGSITRTNGKSGGIVGSNASYTATIEGCTVIGTSVQNGIIIGYANSQQTIKDCIYYDPNGIGIAENTYTDGGGNQRVYQVTLGEGVTATGSVYAYDNKAYYAENATVTLGNNRVGYAFGDYTASPAQTISDGTFAMPAEDVSVSATWTDMFGMEGGADGSAEHPYVISSTDGWNFFCDALQDNTTYNRFSGKTVKLGNNIGTAQDPITRMAGSSGHDFCGTFDGQGHTLNVNLNGAQYVAPFFYVKSQDNDHPATIQNLRVDGTVTASGKFAAGIAGGCHGKVNITNCLVRTTISSSVPGDGTHGGLVGVFDGGTLNITGCAFTGKLLSTGSPATTKCGGIVGYSHVSGTAVNITNSLYAPAALVGSETEPTSNSMTFLRSENTTVTITNSYYTRTLGDAQGTTPYIYTTKPTGIGTEGTMYNVSGITAYTNGIYQNGKYYTTPPDPAHFAQNGDEYTIKSATGWDVFCDLLGESETFSGKTVKLGDGISVTRMAGSANHRFAGTFDGQGNTLTVSYENTDNNTRTAPFSYVDGATIRNLVVDGSITGSAHRAAGIIGETSNNLSHITNCVSSVNISGNRYTAGFSIGGNVAIEGCVFNGKIVGTQYSGGFVGWSHSGLAITNCLFAPQDGSSISGGTFYYNGGGDITPINSYYTTALGTPQGAMALSTATLPANIGTAGTAYSVSGITPYTSGLKYGGLYYMTPEAVSLADNAANDVTSINSYFADVTLQGRTLYKDGAWNTLCLPFSLTAEQIAAHADFAGATLMELDTDGKNGFDATNGTLYLTFKSATAIAAGVPYLVKWDAAGTDFTSPVFSGVTINATATTTVSDADDELQEVQMVGCYSPVPVVANDKSILYLGKANTLYYSSIDNDIRSCRAYFSVPYIKGNAKAMARAFRLDFGDGEQTGITTTNYTNFTNDNDAWYSLDGRRLAGKPTKSGVYVNGGRKVEIK